MVKTLYTGQHITAQSLPQTSTTQCKYILLNWKYYPQKIASHFYYENVKVQNYFACQNTFNFLVLFSFIRIERKHAVTGQLRYWIKGKMALQFWFLLNRKTITNFLETSLKNSLRLNTWASIVNGILTNSVCVCVFFQPWQLTIYKHTTIMKFKLRCIFTTYCYKIMRTKIIYLCRIQGKTVCSFLLTLKCSRDIFSGTLFFH